MPTSGKPPWHAWYKTAHWTALRRAAFIRDKFTCRKCGTLEGDTSRLVCDHVEPHRGDERRFWDADNLQTLCTDCHDRLKQAEEQATRHQRGVWH